MVKCTFAVRFDATQLFFTHTSKEFVNFKTASRLAVGFPINGVGSNNQIITSIEDIYKKKELGNYWVAGTITGVEMMGASSSEQATLPLKRCLIDEFDCVGGTSIIDDFDCVGGTSKKAKEIVVKLEKM
nr:replication protein A 70 kDa DNA-binding subunit B-like [Ipomoea batatas]